MKPTCVVCLLSLILAISAGRADAVLYVEAADAGQVPATAEDVAVTGAIDMLAGRVEHAFDADLFRLVVVNPAAFSAAAIPTAAARTNLQLFAFDAWGHGLAANDDWLQSPLPQLPTGTLAGQQPGVFLLGIAPSDNDPLGIFGEIFSDADVGVSVPVGLSRIDAVLGWSLDFTATGGDYTIALTGVVGTVAPLPGDYNGNGAVDAADYVVWRKGLGTTYTQDDYATWRSHFGQTAGSGALTTVPQSQSNLNRAIPEPASLALLVIGGALLAAPVRRAGSRVTYRSET